MANYFHGVSTRQNDTSISTPVTADSGIAFVVGAAPGHTVGGAPNDPIMCQSYAEAVAALGYSDDWEKYPICEAIYSQFKLYGVAPVVFVNVLDPAKHKKSVAEQNYPVADGKVLLPLEALKNTVKVTSYTAGTDYELFYEGENLILEVLDGGSIPAETGELTITFDAVDPSKINENDIIGGFDTSTKKYSGLELIDKVFPKYGIVPDLIVAPGWSDKSNVAAVMTAKADAINTVFTGAKALIDADTNTVRHYADVPAWKKTQNMNSKAEILCWPMFGLGDRAFHASVHAAGLMGKTDSDNGGCPAESPSNKSLQIDRAMLADGTTVLLDLAQANYLNSNGIVTALNFIGSYVLWGDETACFPADTDVKNYFISVSRTMGNYDTAISGLIEHKEDTKIHVTAEEKASWTEGAEQAAADANRVTEALNAIAGIESRVSRVEDGLFNNITGNPFLASFDSLDGITLVKGIWNEERKRIEC